MGGASSSTSSSTTQSGAFKKAPSPKACPHAFSSGASGALTCPFSGASIEMPVEERVKEMTQGELTSTIAAAGLPTEDCVAVSDLQARAVEAVALGLKRGSVAAVRQEIESALHDRDHVKERRSACVCVCTLHCTLRCVCDCVCVSVCESCATTVQSEHVPSTAYHTHTTIHTHTHLPPPHTHTSFPLKGRRLARPSAHPLRVALQRDVRRGLGHGGQ